MKKTSLTELKLALGENEIFRNHEVFVFPEIDSTNGFIKSRVESFHNEALIALAYHQTAGRGQFGREWADCTGKSLLFSFSLDLDFFLSRQCLPLSLFTGLVCAKFLRSLLENGGEGLWLKWPNDLWFGLQKLGGILVENVVFKEFKGAVVGIGINLTNYEKSGVKYFSPLNTTDQLGILSGILKEFESSFLIGLNEQTELWNYYAEKMFEKKFIAEFADGVEKIVKPQKITKSGELICLDEKGDLIQLTTLRRLRINNNAAT